MILSCSKHCVLDRFPKRVDGQGASTLEELYVAKNRANRILNLSKAVHNRATSSTNHYYGVVEGCLVAETVEDKGSRSDYAEE